VGEALRTRCRERDAVCVEGGRGGGFPVSIRL